MKDDDSAAAGGNDDDRARTLNGAAGEPMPLDDDDELMSEARIQQLIREGEAAQRGGISPDDFEPVPGTETAPLPPRATAAHWLDAWASLAPADLNERWRRDLSAAIAAEATAVETDRLLQYLRRTLGVTMSALRAELVTLREAARADNITPAATHHRHALNVLAAIEDRGRHVSVGGALWREEGVLWRESYRDYKALSVRVPTFATGQVFENNVPNVPKLATLADYDAIARLVFRYRQDDAFFDAAPRGLAVGDRFFALRDGRVSNEPLALLHRQRSVIKVGAPDAALPTPLFDSLLLRALTPTDADAATLARTLGVTVGWADLIAEQIETLLQFFGLALLRQTTRYNTALVMIGASQSGKSVLAAIMEACFPKDERTSSNPTLWDDRRHLLALQGAALNIITELDADKKIPAAQFKTITGGETIEAYRNYHGPVNFAPRAAHIFIANETPRLKDDTDAAWNRLRVVEFFNTMPEAERDRDLAAKIIAQELPGVIGKALAAAERAAAVGFIVRSRIGDGALSRWREENNDVLEFINDSTAVVLTGNDDDKMRREALYALYRTWCNTNQKRVVLGPRKMNEALRACRTAHKLRESMLDGYIVWRGVREGNF